MLPFLQATWRAGLRNQSFHAVLILGIVLVGIAYLSASFSPRQPRTVALDVGFSGIRLSLVLLGLFWVQDLIAKEIDRRTVLWAITYPVPRGWYIIGRFLGVASLLFVAAICLGLLLWFVVRFAAGDYVQGFDVAAGGPFFSTLAGLWLDSVVVVAFAVLIATISTVPMLPLALGLGFAIGGKSLGAVIEYFRQGADGDPALLKMAPVIDAIQWVLPDLSRLDWRNWPMYGLAPDLAAVCLALGLALSYVLLSMSLAIMAFSRREFQ